MQDNKTPENRLYKEEYAYEVIKAQIAQLIFTAKEFKRIRAEKFLKKQEVISVPQEISAMIDLAADTVLTFEKEGEETK